MHRLKLNTVTVLLLAAAATTFAGEIPDRPEELQFPDLTFTAPDADALRFELTDGTAVYAKRDTQFPLVNITLYFHGGRYLVPAGKEGLAAITSEVWRNGGAGELTAQQLDEELDFLAANLRTSIGDVRGSVSLNVLSKDLDAAMALFLDVLTKPRFQEDRFAKAKDDLIQDMKTRNDNTAGIERREWQRLIYGDDYWQNQLATKASVDSITPSDCKSFINSLVRSGNLVFAVAGDFDRDEIKALLERTIANLEPLTEPLPPVPQPQHTPAPGVYTINKPDVNQGRVSIGHLGYKLGQPRQFPLMVGADILGGGGFTARMMKRIRSDEGLAYGAYAALDFPVPMPGTFRAFFQSKSSTCAYATEMAFDLIESMRAAEVTNEELRTAKNSFIETFPRFFESPTRTVGIFATDDLLGRPHSYWATYRDKMAAVTAGQIKAAMTEDIRPDEMIVLVVGNIEEIMKGHPDHEAKFTDFGPIHKVPLRDPLTLEPIVE